MGEWANGRMGEWANGRVGASVLALSRRDRVKVTRQFIAWKVPQDDPSRRVRCDPSNLRCRCTKTFRSRMNLHARRETAGGNLSYRTLRGGSFLRDFPGNELPGYLHSVPTGQISTSNGLFAKKKNVRQLDSIAGLYIPLKKSGRNHFERGSVKTWTPVCRLTDWTW